MATLPTHLQNKPNSAAIAATLDNQAKQATIDATPKVAGAPELTFRHLTSGSTFIMPSGKVLQFMGKAGGVGDYTTSDQSEIEELMKAAKVANVPLELVLSKPLTEVKEIPTGLKKPLEPNVAAAEAAAIAERSANPAVISAQDNLGKLIANTTGTQPA